MRVFNGLCYDCGIELQTISGQVKCLSGGKRTSRATDGVYQAHACLILPQRDRRIWEAIGSKIVFSHLRRGTRTLQQHRNEVRAR